MFGFLDSGRDCYEVTGFDRSFTTMPLMFVAYLVLKESEAVLASIKEEFS